MPPKRKSIAERNAAAIAQEIVEPAQVAELEQDVVPVAVTETQPVEAPSASVREVAVALGDRKTLGIYLTPSFYNEMKSAYLADWSNVRGDADTLHKWVEMALNKHALRRSAERGNLALRRKRGAETGASRAFKIAPSVYDRMQRAIADDERKGRWLSDSAWSVEALAAAIHSAREANGGLLPVAPARLPNRLKRR